MTASLNIGDLIIDNRGRECIVIAESPPPTDSWLNQQNDSRVRSMKNCRWWQAVPDTGGGVCVPEPLAQHLRAATIEDAKRYAQNFAQSYYVLLRLFPALGDVMPAPRRP